MDASLASLTDEELLLSCYNQRQLMTPLEQELSARLEQALDALGQRPVGVGDVLTRSLLDMEARHGADT